LYLSAAKFADTCFTPGDTPQRKMYSIMDAGGVLLCRSLSRALRRRQIDFSAAAHSTLRGNKFLKVKLPWW